MSYDFTGANDYITGTLGTQRAMPLTLACWLKISAWPAGDAYLLNLGANVGGIADSLAIVARANTGGGDRLTPFKIDASVNAGALTSTFTYSAASWYPVVCCLIADTGTPTIRIYHGSGPTTASDTDTQAVASTLQYLRIGEALSGGSEFQGRIAEVAIWSGELSSGNAALYCGGTSADQIDSGNLLAYWDLLSDATKYAGSDSIGTLSVTGATAQAGDHPTITHASAGGALLLPQYDRMFRQNTLLRM